MSDNQRRQSTTSSGYGDISASSRVQNSNHSERHRFPDPANARVSSCAAAAQSTCICRGHQSTPTVHCGRCQSKFVCVHSKELSHREQHKEMKRFDPFHPVEKVLQIVVLPVGTYKHSFDLPTSDMHDWKRCNKEVWVISMKVHDDKLAHYWPSSLSLNVNEFQVLKIDAPTPERKRRDELFNATKFFKNGTNCINLEISEKQEDFVVGFLLTRVLTPIQLEHEILAKQYLPEDKARERVRSLLNKSDSNDDELVVMGSNRLPLTCPITLTKMAMPARGLLCDHIQCFDISNYLQVNEKMKAVNNRWKCAVCSLYRRPDELEVDGWAHEVLNKTDASAKEVEVCSRGDWRITRIEEETIDDDDDYVEEPVKNTIPVCTQTIKHDPDAASNKRPLEASEIGNSKRRKWESTVIDILDSDDEEAPPPPPKTVTITKPSLATSADESSDGSRVGNKTTASNRCSERESSSFRRSSTSSSHQSSDSRRSSSDARLPQKKQTTYSASRRMAEIVDLID
eukprot:GHVL01002338.1.p1 GENE.GHVL01002338.1~~GHVL01002338.1.p1  ORF type:complete len:513 (+),score=84.74 GHVL01002338.1:2304-3842(+)